MPPRNVSYAEVSVFAHATEDLSKVMSSVLRILPDQMAHRVQFAQTSMRGHHGNPIAELKLSVADRRDAYEVLRGILSRLSPLDSTLLDEELSKHLDERRHLYLRLDKQRAFLGEIALSSGDAISLTFRLRSSPKSLEELRESLDTDGRRGDGTDESL